MLRVALAISRLLIAGVFIRSGWDAYHNPGDRAQKAARMGLPQPEIAVQANGLGMAGAGSALALGLAPRASARVLAGLLVPTTLAGHRFWEEPTTQGRERQLTQFLKNAAMLGGLLAYLVADNGSRHL